MTNYLKIDVKTMTLVYDRAFAKNCFIVGTAEYAQLQDAMKTFEAKQEGLTYEDAISMMICNYGGVARKQVVTAVNAFYFNELNKLVTESMTLPKSEIQSKT